MALIRGVGLTHPVRLLQRQARRADDSVTRFYRTSAAAKGRGLMAAGGVRQWVTEAVAFVIAVSWAIASNLQPAELVWGLWISSLTSGWLLLLLTFATSILFPAAARIPEAERTGQRAAAMVVIGAIFIGVFGVVHAALIAMFESVVGAPAALDARTSGDAVRQFLGLAWSTLRLYWPIALATSVVALQVFVHAVTSEEDDDLILGPWIGIVRLQVVTFVLVGFDLLGLRSVLVAGLLAVVFFPVERYAFAHVRSRGSPD